MKPTYLPTRLTGIAPWIVLQLAACVLPSGDLGELEPLSGSDSSSETSAGPGGGMTATSTGATSVTGADGESGDVPADCDVPQGPVSCEEDGDHDSILAACDNDDAHFNPSQRDADADGIGDTADPCPTIASGASLPDSDTDGIGNECDSCPFVPSYYRGLVEGAPVDPALDVRNVPDFGDVDLDGIGDACDNCVAVANCEGFGAADPYVLGDPIARDDEVACQSDADHDGIGDACEGVQAPGAAGPVGFGVADDFDQDGLLNGIDGCARLPVVSVACSDDGACPAGSTCAIAAGVCHHVDSDGDEIGDACDTCAEAVNGGQLDAGGVEDDADGDFVGAACEPDVACAVRPQPMRIAFFPVAVEGRCCAVQLVENHQGDLVRNDSGAPIRDPDGRPVRLDCVVDDPESATCARLPDSVRATPGMITPPAGCTEALGSLEAVVAQQPVDEPDAAQLWGFACELPPYDDDFDGLGDECDFCWNAFDPTNEIYVDDNGMVWPNDGKYCNGDYSDAALCGELD